MHFLWSASSWCNGCGIRIRQLTINVHQQYKKFGGLRALFFGTDDFAVTSLKLLVNTTPSPFLKLDVVTSVQTKANPVQNFAREQKLTILEWPLLNLAKGDYDVGLVVSFGHLIPEVVINNFKFGMLNVHASLLPRWRGAAPIIYAILSGDKETGITIMRIQPKRFDIGEIVSQQKCCIEQNETMPQLSKRLAQLGANMLLSSIRNLPECLQSGMKQPDYGVTYAPRVTSALARVDFNEMGSTKVLNLSRALDGLYHLSCSWHGKPIKLIGPAEQVESNHDVELRPRCNDGGHQELEKPGSVRLLKIGQDKFLAVLCCDKVYVTFKAVGVPGKKPLTPLDFYNGYISKVSRALQRLS